MSEKMSALAFFRGISSERESVCFASKRSRVRVPHTPPREPRAAPTAREDSGSLCITKQQLSMKQKIKEALQQGHKNLGLSEEVFERVAASVETFITDDSAIDAYVQSESTLALLKSYQSVADKARAKAQAKNEAPADTPEQETEQQEASAADITEVVAKAVAAAIAPLEAKLTGYETAERQKGAVAALNELRGTWDYAKGYPEECADAYEVTIELYEASGKTWTGEELKAKFTEKFNKAVSKKGVDTTKPFRGEKGETSKPDFSDHVEFLKRQGLLKDTK